MAHDQALLKNAKIDLERYRALWQQDSIPKQQLDTQDALVRQYEGAIKTDQGQIDNAKLQLTYSRITSPITGGSACGSWTRATSSMPTDANGLLVITQLQPITVIFPIPEDNLPPGARQAQSGQRLPVEAYDRDQTQKLATGCPPDHRQPDRPHHGHGETQGDLRQQGQCAFPQPVRQCQSSD